MTGHSRIVVLSRNAPLSIKFSLRTPFGGTDLYSSYATEGSEKYFTFSDVDRICDDCLLDPISLFRM